MKSFKKYAAIGAVTVSAVMPLISLAQSYAQVPVSRVEDIFNILQRILNWAAALFFLVAVAYIFLAGFTYLQAGGDETKFAEAKNRIIYALIAIAVGLIAFSVPRIVENFLR